MGNEIDITPGSVRNEIKEMGKTNMELMEEVSKSLLEVGFAVVDLGVAVSKYPLERYKAQKAKKDRIAYPLQKVVVAKLHYTQENGYFFCFGGECCEDLGLPSVRYGLLMIRYTTNAKAEVLNKDIEFFAHILGYDSYQNLQDVKQFANINDDLIITCTEEQWQKIVFTSVPGKSLWREDEVSKKMVEEQAEKLFQFLPVMMGTKLKREDYLKNKVSDVVESVSGVKSGVDFSLFKKTT